MSLPIFKSRFVDVLSLRTHYFDEGVIDAPAVILLHGGGAGADARGNWHKTIPELARNFRVLALDMIGFGDSAKPHQHADCYTQPGRNAHLIAFIEALKLTHGGGVGLAGNSMGGATAFRLSETPGINGQRGLEYGDL